MKKNYVVMHRVWGENSATCVCPTKELAQKYAKLLTANDKKIGLSLNKENHYYVREVYVFEE